MVKAQAAAVAEAVQVAAAQPEEVLVGRLAAARQAELQLGALPGPSVAELLVAQAQGSGELPGAL
jgi:hypothetical protein